MSVVIGISTLNRATLLPRALDSALAQTYTPTRVAVFDDASHDATPTVRARYPQVSWERTDHPIGLIAARNQLMRASTEAFYCSLDDDAWFMRGDELTRAVQVLDANPHVAAIAFDILSPERPTPTERGTPFPVDMYIGCGHVLRLTAVREVGYYAETPGHYGSEEKDLCVRLLDRGHEILLMPGVHVWHERTPTGREHDLQYRSAVCNDLVFAVRRCPAPLVFAVVPAKCFSHFRFSLQRGWLKPGLQGFADFARALPRALATRQPVSVYAFQEQRRRARRKGPSPA